MWSYGIPLHDGGLPLQFKFEGENNSTAAGQLQIALKRLSILKKIPIKVNRHLMEVMQTSSVSKFNYFFAQLQFNLKHIPTMQISTE